jgi:hypothetical protein
MALNEISAVLIEQSIERNQIYAAVWNDDDLIVRVPRKIRLKRLQQHTIEALEQNLARLLCPLPLV